MSDVLQQRSAEILIPSALSAEESVRVTIRGYEFPHETKYASDGNWLRAILHVRSRGFEAAVEGCFETTCLDRMKRSLEALTSGHAGGLQVLSSMDEWLGLTIDRKNDNSFDLRGWVSEEAGRNDNLLEWQFEVDVGMLPRILNEVNEAIRTYPQRGGEGRILPLWPPVDVARTPVRCEDVLKWVHATPFVAFTVGLWDGSGFEVRHPSMCIVGETSILIGIPEDRDSQVASRIQRMHLDEIGYLGPVEDEA